jgi:hypothetical protein
MSRYHSRYAGGGGGGSTIGPSFVGAVTATLTDKSSWSGAASSDEQWGTEEATLDDALLPALTDVTVNARLTGSAVNINETGFFGARVEISLDGGATWNGAAADVETQFRIVTAATTARQMVYAEHLVTGTVTDDIQARAIVRNGIGAASVIDLENGRLYMTVIAP